MIWDPQEVVLQEAMVLEAGGDGSGSGGVGSGDLAAAENEDAPVITGVDAFFTEYEGQGDLIEVHVYYVDAQDDVEVEIWLFHIQQRHQWNRRYKPRRVECFCKPRRR